MKWPNWQAALLVTIVRFANSRLGQALGECARVVHLAPGLLPAGLGLLPSQQEGVAEEFRALLQAGASVDEDGPARDPQGFTGREVESKTSN
ncbi:MAG: hypothetical protein JSU97_00080 [Dehalococcoidia bacterium]|nr:MAG: hypothetical protein JSU97_00080 [Dehalococcoidia bacterium]